MSRRRRQLSTEERTLWEAVARTVAPLDPNAAVAPELAPAPRLPEAAETAKAVEPPKPAPAVASRPVADRPPLHPLGRRTLSRVARGQVEIDARIDLHGLTQLDAHDRLRRFLVDAQARGAKLALVITGKGRAETESGWMHEPGERGVLRRRVPQWLAEPGLRGVVIGFEEAHRSHGGGGALYVRIRKRRTAPGSSP